ncbi:MAG: XRE family transcriptional regulator [Burkholderiaceae bacterium]|nr:XRE family transcriptional regulator [Burkholderiaceae bacterium]MCD8536259.1 XRE family transcriptional regulator [Burkholderiaceae bacterium]
MSTPTLDVLGRNLQRLRLARGMSQEKLAQASGINRVTYNSIERRRVEPRGETVRALAKALGVRVPELLTEVPVLKHVRFRSLKRLKGRDQVLAQVAQKLQDFAELESLLGVRCAADFNVLRKFAAKSHRQSIAAVAATVRAHFGLTDREPVHDICGLLEHAGVKVLSVDMATDAFLGLSVAEQDGGPAVVVNTWDRLPVEHWIFSAAHELGHLLLHLNAYEVAEYAHNEDEEREADAFASHFLMPEAVFRREWDDTVGMPLFDRVLKVKRVFRVSWRTVLYRLAQSVSRVDERQRLWQQFVIAYQQRNRKVLLKLDEPDGIGADVFRALSQWHKAGPEPAGMERHDFQGDRLWRLVRLATIEGHITLGRAAEILGLGLKETRELAQSWVN